MKTFKTIILLLVCGTSLLLGFNNKPSTQIVFHSNDLEVLTSQINSYYAKGYKVIFTENQSITTANQTSTYKGQVLIIMEKN